MEQHQKDVIEGAAIAGGAALVFRHDPLIAGIYGASQGLMLDTAYNAAVAEIAKVEAEEG